MYYWYIEQWLCILRRTTSETRPPSYESVRRDVTRLMRFPRHYTNFSTEQLAAINQMDAQGIGALRDHYQHYMDWEVLKLALEHFPERELWALFVRTIHKNALWHTALIGNVEG